MYILYIDLDMFHLEHLLGIRDKLDQRREPRSHALVEVHVLRDRRLETEASAEVRRRATTE